MLYRNAIGLINSNLVRLTKCHSKHYFKRILYHFVVGSMPLIQTVTRKLSGHRYTKPEAIKMNLEVSCLGASLVETKWQDCTTTLGCPSDVASEWRQIILEYYGESQRHYHTIRHLEEMFQHLNEVDQYLQDLPAVVLAVLFHDIIYNPRSSTNEEESAEIFREFAGKFKMKHCLIQTVSEYINQTKTHKTDAHTTPAAEGTQDLHYFLDMDMAVLGRTPEGYKEYAEQIRQEYIHIPDEAYRKARANVLETFLQLPNIFATKIFREKYEERARQNIMEEIKILRS